MIELFHEKQAWKKQEVIDYFKTKKNLNIPPGTFAKIMKELAIHSGSSWKAKTGTVDGK